MTQIDTSGSRRPLRAFRIRVAVFLVAVTAILFLIGTVYRGINTINLLDAVEAERDQWQRPNEVLRALNLREGSIVVDLGSGAGYFALKLGHSVGRSGRVVAVDIRRLSLLFLWIRAFLGNQRNITVVHGRAEDLDRSDGPVDAVLVANTYHEFNNAKAVLGGAFRSLTRGGRLVVLDRGPHTAGQQHGESEHHEVPAAAVKDELMQSGFEILAREDHFIDRPSGEAWWLIVARKP